MEISSIIHLHGELNYRIIRSEEEFYSIFTPPSNMQDYFDEIGIEREYPIILLGKISVSQGQQDQGIGTRLLKDLEEIAREKSVTLIFLKVGWPSNENNKEVRTKNMHFYKKSGYDMVEPVNKRSPSYKLAPFAFKEMA